MTERRLRVLVAEDEAMIAIMVEDFLDLLGYDVARLCASNRDCAQFLDSGESPDLAVLDCHLVDGTVWETARRLRAAHVPVLFASGNDGHGVPDDLRHCPVLGKPFAMDALGRHLREMAIERNV